MVSVFGLSSDRLCVIVIIIVVIVILVVIVIIVMIVVIVMIVIIVTIVVIVILVIIVSQRAGPRLGTRISCRASWTSVAASARVSN